MIVESHSDHLVNGVRLAARDKVIRADAVAVHFFGGGQAEEDRRSRQISVQEDGALDDWPAGFFDQAMTDLIRLS